ncbi:MAG TPA: molybdopterin-guanine dinucleotide biosynthesis protein B [Campylobacterales bacterium]|nr:molybdopterin-guanine dinucleotide biosynthesis protein B [Campylobacterales bacterium]
MRVAVAFTGPSNSGKTTVIVKVAERLKSAHKVAVVKNDPKDKAVFDTEGKDSSKFFATGANVVVRSPTRTTMFKNETSSLDEIISMLGAFDILLVEGLKTLPIPRIGVFRGELDPDYFGFVKAIAIDDAVDVAKYDLPKEIEVLDLNNTEKIVEWIFKNAKEV